MAQLRRFTSSVGVGVNVPVAHGLSRTPDIVVIGHGCGANISLGGTAADATNVYITNAGGGAQNANILAWALHSIIA